MSSCLPSKFYNSRRQILAELLVKSSVHNSAASYSFPVLRCSAVTGSTGASLNLSSKSHNRKIAFKKKKERKKETSQNHWCVHFRTFVSY